MLVWPPKSQTWNLMLLYVTVSTLKPMAAQSEGGASGARRLGCSVMQMEISMLSQCLHDRGPPYLGWLTPPRPLASGLRNTRKAV